MLFAYFGPETVLPITSTVAAITGFFLMFGRHTVRLAVGVARQSFRLKERQRPVLQSAGRRFRVDGSAGSLVGPRAHPVTHARKVKA